MPHFPEVSIAALWTTIICKIETGFYFAFSSLTLQAFTILYFSYI